MRKSRVYCLFLAVLFLSCRSSLIAQTALPDDLEQAAVEQVAYWFHNRDKSGLVRSWPHDGTYEAFAQLDLLLEVRAVLKKYERWSL